MQYSTRSSRERAYWENNGFRVRISGTRGCQCIWAFVGGSGTGNRLAKPVPVVPAVAGLAGCYRIRARRAHQLGGVTLELRMVGHAITGKVKEL